MDGRGDGMVHLRSSGDSVDCWAEGSRVSAVTKVDHRGIDGDGFSARLNDACQRVVTLTDPEHEIRIGFKPMAKVKQIPVPDAEPNKAGVLPMRDADFDVCSISTP